MTLRQLVYQRYSDQYYPTIEDEHTTTIEVAHTVCRLDIIDTAGQSPYQSEAQMSASNDSKKKNADAVVLVYDMTSRQSFREIALIFNLEEHSPNVSIMLVATKLDKEEQREVRPEEGLALAQEVGGSFVEVSARTAHGVEEAVQHLVSVLLARSQGRTNDRAKGLRETPQENFWQACWQSISVTGLSCIG